MTYVVCIRTVVKVKANYPISNKQHSINIIEVFSKSSFGPAFRAQLSSNGIPRKNPFPWCLINFPANMEASSSFFRANTPDIFEYFRNVSNELNANYKFLIIHEFNCIRWMYVEVRNKYSFTCSTLSRNSLFKFLSLQTSSTSTWQMASVIATGQMFRSYSQGS